MNVTVVLETFDYKFITTDSQFGRIRWLVADVGGRKFHVRREFDGYVAVPPPFARKEEFEKQADELLILQMQYMISKALIKGIDLVPDGEIGESL